MTNNIKIKINYKNINDLSEQVNDLSLEGGSSSRKFKDPFGDGKVRRKRVDNKINYFKSNRTKIKAKKKAENSI